MSLIYPAVLSSPLTIPRYASLAASPLPIIINGTLFPFILLKHFYTRLQKVFSLLCNIHNAEYLLRKAQQVAA